MYRPQLSRIWMYLCVIAAISRTGRTDTCPSSSPGAEAHIGFNPDKCVITPNQTKNSVTCYDPLNTTYSENDLRWFKEDEEVVFGTGMGDAFQIIELNVGYNTTRIFFSKLYLTPGCYTCRNIIDSTVYRDLEAYEFVNTTLIPPSATTAAPMIPGALCMDPTTQPPTTIEQTTANEPTTAATTVQTEYSTGSNILSTIKQTSASTAGTTTQETDSSTTKNLPLTTFGFTSTQLSDDDDDGDNDKAAIIGLSIGLGVAFVWAVVATALLCIEYKSKKKVTPEGESD